MTARHDVFHAVSRLALRLWLCLVVTATIGVNTANALPSFGGWQYALANEYGGQLNIRTPNASDETIDPNEIALARSVAQGPGGTAAPLIQAGLYRSGTNSTLDMCPAEINAYDFYYEYRQASGNYICGLTGSGTQETAAPGVDNNASVFSYGNGTWGASVVSGTDDGGPFFGPSQLGFVTGATYMGSELNNGSKTLVAVKSRRSTLYGGGTGSTGPFTGPGWYVYYHAFDIYTFGAPAFVYYPGEVTRVLPTTAGWTVPNVPTPLTVTHTPE